MKAKIINTEYIKEADIVSWQVKLENGKDADLVWPREDFGKTFNIKHEIPEPLLLEFCKSMIGKTINVLTEEEKKE